MKEGYPKVLIGAPVCSHKLYCTGQYIRQLKRLTYPNFTVVLVDNSPTDDLRTAIKPSMDLMTKNGKPAYTVTTPCRAYVRERLVEGRNLLIAIMEKQEDISSFGLNKEDEEVIRNLQKENFEYLFSLEQDVLPPEDIIERLIADKKDIVSGIYFNSKKLGMPGQETIATIPMVWRWTDDEVKEAEILLDSDLMYLLPSRVQETAAVGVGCLLVHKKVFDAGVRFRYQPEKYACDDMFFCLDASRAGFSVNFDSYVWCTHLHSMWDITQVGER